MNRAVRYPITTSVTAAQNWLEIEPKSSPWIAAEVSLPQPALALKVERHGRGVSPPASWQFGFGKVGALCGRRGGGVVTSVAVSGSTAWTVCACPAAADGTIMPGSLNASNPRVNSAVAVVELRVKRYRRR